MIKNYRGCHIRLPTLDAFYQSWGINFSLKMNCLLGWLLFWTSVLNWTSRANAVRRCSILKRCWCNKWSHTKKYFVMVILETVISGAFEFWGQSLESFREPWTANVRIGQTSPLPDHGPFSPCMNIFSGDTEQWVAPRWNSEKLKNPNC